MRLLRRFCVLGLLFCLVACSAGTLIKGGQSGTTLNLRGTVLELPAQHSLRGTSFGNYEFKAQAPGLPPFYGLLPLNFKGTHLAMDILFFAPGAFFNLRGAFPYYQIDVEKQVVRFKKKGDMNWTEISPKRAEIDRARAYFGDKD